MHWTSTTPLLELSGDLNQNQPSIARYPNTSVKDILMSMAFLPCRPRCMSTDTLKLPPSDSPKPIGSISHCSGPWIAQYRTELVVGEKTRPVRGKEKRGIGLQWKRLAGGEGGHVGWH